MYDTSFIVRTIMTSPLSYPIKIGVFQIFSPHTHSRTASTLAAAA